MKRDPVEAAEDALYRAMQQYNRAVRRPGRLERSVTLYLLGPHHGDLRRGVLVRDHEATLKVWVKR